MSRSGRPSAIRRAEDAASVASRPDQGSRGRSIGGGGQADDGPQPSPIVRRLLAAFLDWVAIQLLTTPVLRPWKGSGVPPPANPGARWTAIAIFAVYTVGATALFGRTLGKWMLGLRVSRADRFPPGVVASTVRYVVGLAALLVWYALPASWARSSAELWVVTLWPLAVLAPALFDPKRRGLHDRVAGTRVTYLPRHATSQQSDPSAIG